MGEKWTMENFSKWMRQRYYIEEDLEYHRNAIIMAKAEYKKCAEKLDAHDRADPRLGNGSNTTESVENEISEKMGEIEELQVALAKLRSEEKDPPPHRSGCDFCEAKEVKTIKIIGNGVDEWYCKECYNKKQKALNYPYSRT
jgi:hypothetical protein